MTGGGEYSGGGVCCCVRVRREAHDGIAAAISNLDFKLAHFQSKPTVDPHARTALRAALRFRQVKRTPPRDMPRTFSDRIERSLAGFPVSTAVFSAYTLLSTKGMSTLHERMNSGLVSGLAFSVPGNSTDPGHGRQAVDEYYLFACKAFFVLWVGGLVVWSANWGRFCRHQTAKLQQLMMVIPVLSCVKMVRVLHHTNARVC